MVYGLSEAVYMLSKFIVSGFSDTQFDLRKFVMDGRKWFAACQK